MATAKSVSPFLPKKYPCLYCLTELTEWEFEHLPFLKSSSGRSLYNALLLQCCINPMRTKFPFKTLRSHLTDKTLRMRMHDFEKLGLLTFNDDAKDGRTRTVTPTDKLLAFFDLHSIALHKKFSHRFLILPKE